MDVRRKGDLAASTALKREALESRNRKILELLADGMTKVDVAARFGISVHAVHAVARKGAA